MFAVRVQIVRFTLGDQLGWVECMLQDAYAREWLFSDKAPIFSAHYLDADSSYPQLGEIACEVIREWADEQGRKRCLIDTTRPWGIASRGGQTQFEVFFNQLTPPSR